VIGGRVGISKECCKEWTAKPKTGKMLLKEAVAVVG